MPAGFKSPPTKDAVRRLWCTELLTAIQNQIGRRYYYLGLPGPEAKDLQEWHESQLVGRVCAFQMLDIQAADQLGSLKRLERFLADTFAPRGIPYRTYAGLLEDVVINRRDVRTREFKQDALVTLYQLDFCHALTDDTWKTIKLNYRYQAIRDLIVYQCSQPIQEKARPFVLFLTVRDEIGTAALERFIADWSGSTEGTLVAQMMKEKPIKVGKDGRALAKQVRHPCLKAFVYCTLNEAFWGHNIRTLFLPPVYYTGTSVKHPMVVFTVLGAFDSLTRRTPKKPQMLKDFLAVEGLELSKDKLVGVRRCGLETQRAWSASGIMKKYVDEFVADPIWTKIEQQAKAVSVRP